MRLQFPISGVILVLACAAFTTALADTVYLRNGERVEGSVSREGDKVIVRRADGTKTTYSAGEIDHIDEASAEEDSPDRVEPASTAATPDTRTEAVVAKLRATADLAQAIAEFKAAGERAVPALLRVLRGDTAEDRLRAVKVLAEIRSSAANESLRHALADGDPRVRTEAARALGAIGSPDSQIALLTAMLGDPQPDVNAAAAGALCRISGAFSIPFLVDSLRNPTLRPIVEDGLLESENPATASFLGPLFVSDDAAVRKSALRLLSDAAQPCNVGALLSLLKDKECRRPALAAISRLRVRKDCAIPVSIELLSADEFSKSAMQYLRRASGKSFEADASAWHSWYTPTVVRRICIVPFGRVSPEMVKKVTLAVQAEFKQPATLSKQEIAIPAGCRFDNGQYNADAFLDALDDFGRKNADILRVVGVTDVDLGLPGSGYYFSPGRPGGPLVVSSWRLKSSDLGVTWSRAVTQTIHALGRSLSLSGCAKADCPLSDVYVADDLDTKKPHACKDCTGRIAYVIEAERALAAWDPRAVELFEAMVPWDTGDVLFTRIATVFEMWKEPDRAARLWRVMSARGTDPQLKELTKKRMAAMGL